MTATTSRLWDMQSGHADDRPVLVVGATGTQGGAVVDALLGLGAPVRALVRDRRSRAALALADRGVALAPGDLDDEASLDRAMRGAVGVFSVQPSSGPDGPEAELRAGRQLVGAARRGGVEVFVHTSVARAGRQHEFAGWSEGRWERAYWEAKSGVNELVRAAGFARHCILKPAVLMECYLPPKVHWFCPTLAQGRIVTAMRPERRLDLVAAADVGRFAAAAFAEPERFDGQEIDLAAESLTADEIAAAIAAATARPVAAHCVSAQEALAAGVAPVIVSNQQWANAEGYRVDLARARGHGLDLCSFADWARRRREEFVFA